MRVILLLSGSALAVEARWKSGRMFGLPCVLCSLFNWNLVSRAAYLLQSLGGGGDDDDQILIKEFLLPVTFAADLALFDVSPCRTVSPCQAYLSNGSFWRTLHKSTLIIIIST